MSGADELVTREVFDAELRELGERMSSEGKPAIQTLLNDGFHCRFDNWPKHLKADAYRKLGLEPVHMFRRVPRG